MHLSSRIDRPRAAPNVPLATVADRRSNAERLEKGIRVKRSGPAAVRSANRAPFLCHWKWEGRGKGIKPEDLAVPIFALLEQLNFEKVHCSGVRCSPATGFCRSGSRNTGPLPGMEEAFGHSPI